VNLLIDVSRNKDLSKNVVDRRFKNTDAALCTGREEKCENRE
jgi:hypothetical protein